MQQRKNKVFYDKEQGSKYSGRAGMRKHSPAEVDECQNHVVSKLHDKKQATRMVKPFSVFVSVLLSQDLSSCILFSNCKTTLPPLNPPPCCVPPSFFFLFPLLVLVWPVGPAVVSQWFELYLHIKYVGHLFISVYSDRTFITLCQSLQLCLGPDECYMWHWFGFLYVIIKCDIIWDCNCL